VAAAVLATPIPWDPTWLGGTDAIKTVVGTILAIGLIASGVILVLSVAGFAVTRATGGTFIGIGHATYSKGIAAAIIGAVCLGSLAAATGWGIGQAGWW
jgi:hypothetical protein